MKNALSLTVILSMLLVTLTGCFQQQETHEIIRNNVTDDTLVTEDDASDTDDTVDSEDNDMTTDDTSFKEAAEAVISALSSKDLNALAVLVHEDEGVRFSPYPMVDAENDFMLFPDALPGIFEDEKTYTFGYFDGSGEPIEKTFKEYYEEFVYDQDFMNADEIAYNELIGSGNTPSNLEEVYPGAMFVEYHFEGFDTEYNGMDWESLRLVFKKIEGKWYLVGVVHAQWTI